MQRPRHAHLTCLAVSLLVAILVSPAVATVLHVPADYATIQAAIDAAVVGDIVEIACGTYQVPEIIMKSGITLRSATGQADCVVLTPADPINDPRLLHCVVGTTTQLKGLTFYRGTHLLIEGSPLIENCRFENNYGTFFTAEQIGARRALVEPLFSDAAIQFVNSNSTVVNCVFVDNAASGSPITVPGGDVTFDGCTFGGNYAADGGGGAIGGESVLFVDCTFSGNHAYFDGGAAHC